MSEERFYTSVGEDKDPFTNSDSLGLRRKGVSFKPGMLDDPEGLCSALNLLLWTVAWDEGFSLDVCRTVARVKDGKVVAIDIIEGGDIPEEKAA